MHVMIDLETLGTQHNAPIVSIGACTFSMDESELPVVRRTFYREISTFDDGTTIDPATIGWWLRQSNDAREFLAHALEEGEPLVIALEGLANFLDEHLADDLVWAKPASFDLTILRCAYERFGMKLPWSFRKYACMTQYFRGHPEPTPQVPFTGTPHNALDDAIHQAQRLESAIGYTG